MKNAILVPGVIAGVLLGLAFMLLAGTSAGVSYVVHEGLTLLAMLVAVLAAEFVAIRRHPMGIQAGYPARYFAAMLTGAVTALVHGLLTWLYFAVVNPGYLEGFYDRYVERALAPAQTEAEREAALVNAQRMQEFVMDPLSQALVQFGTVLMIALLAGILAAALARPAPAR